MRRHLGIALIFFFNAWQISAQSRESGDASHGFTFYERFQGSTNTLGVVTRLDTNAGYQFNSHFSVDGGIPVYFIRPSAASTAATGTRSANGIGNVYAQFRLTLASPVLNFASTLTGTAPTGDKATGFSTGSVTVDWSNYFERSFSRLTPFADIGIANSVSDTFFFVRPYTTLGFVSHFDGGARYRIARALHAGASLYAIEPSGRQTVLSRLFAPQQQAAAAGNSGRGNRNQGVFESASVTTGSAEIARDHGFSTWIQISPASTLDLYAGYTRSTQYALDTVFFGMGVNLGKVFRKWGM
jgi:hypothetical protein